MAVVAAQKLGHPGSIREPERNPGCSSRDRVRCRHCVHHRVYETNLVRTTGVIHVPSVNCLAVEICRTWAGELGKN